MEYTHIKVEKSDHIATVYFDRPKKANALNYEHLREIQHASQSFSEDSKIRAIISDVCKVDFKIVLITRYTYCVC